MTQCDPGFSNAQFITFEGIDGCGKTTLLDRLSRWLDAVGIAHVVTREPGGTPLGERIRGLLLDPVHAGMDEWAEVLLMTAARAQHVKELIRPSLVKGLWVLSDRFFDASLAYQGYGRGLDPDRLRSLQKWATGGLKPHLTVLLDCAVPVALERRAREQNLPDRIEAEEAAFHEKVRQGYLEIARMEPERFIVLDAGRDLEEVVESFRENLIARGVDLGEPSHPPI